MARPDNQPGKTRRVFCTHCGEENEVARRAMSVFCAHCRRRLILEDYRIRSYHAVRLFATCGDIVVEKRGLVSAPVRVQNLTVKGKLMGDIDARGRVEVAGSGEIRGRITAPRLVVRGGGVIHGYCRIGTSGNGTHPTRSAGCSSSLPG